MSKTPQIYEWMSEDEKLFRQSAETNFLESAKIAGYDDLISYEAMQLGHSSVVYKFETEKGVFVCKLAGKDIFSSDVLFYDICNQYGIKSLRVFENIQINEKLFACFMEYIPEKTVVEIPKDEVLTSGKYAEIGKSLAELHKIKGDGFGDIQTSGPLIGAYPTLAEFINSRFISHETIESVSEYFQPFQINIVYEAVEFLNSSYQNGEKGSLCHGDMSTSNAFNTTPVTIFDPGPAMIMHPMLDLALTIVYESREEDLFTQIQEQLIIGYENVSKVDRKTLSAAILIMCVRKLATAIKKNNLARINSYLRLFKQQSEIFSE